MSDAMGTRDGAPDEVQACEVGLRVEEVPADNELGVFVTEWVEHEPPFPATRYGHRPSGEHVTEQFIDLRWDNGVEQRCISGATVDFSRRPPTLDGCVLVQPELTVDGHIEGPTFKVSREEQFSDVAWKSKESFRAAGIESYRTVYRADGDSQQRGMLLELRWTDGTEESWPLGDHDYLTTVVSEDGHRRAVIMDEDSEDVKVYLRQRPATPAERAAPIEAEGIAVGEASGPGLSRHPDGSGDEAILARGEHDCYYRHNGHAYTVRRWNGSIVACVDLGLVSKAPEPTTVDVHDNLGAVEEARSRNEANARAIRHNGIHALSVAGPRSADVYRRPSDGNLLGIVRDGYGLVVETVDFGTADLDVVKVDLPFHTSPPDLVESGAKPAYPDGPVGGFFEHVGEPAVVAWEGPWELQVVLGTLRDAKRWSAAQDAVEAVRTGVDGWTSWLTRDLAAAEELVESTFCLPEEDR